MFSVIFLAAFVAQESACSTNQRKHENQISEFNAWFFHTHFVFFFAKKITQSLIEIPPFG